MKIVWLDLETTGLNPEQDKILEVAVKVCTLEEPFPDSTVKPPVSYQAAIAFDRTIDTVKIDPYVDKMHTENGLFAECARSTIGVSNVEHILLSMIDVNTDRENMTTLAGSSVHFDLAFLRVHMPALAKHLSHRLYDVSAVKLFCRSIGMPKLPRQEAHRAMADVNESIDHAMKCAEWCNGQRFAPFFGISVDRARRELKAAGVELTLNISDNEVLEIHRALQFRITPEGPVTHPKRAL